MVKRVGALLLLGSLSSVSALDAKISLAPSGAPRMDWTRLVVATSEGGMRMGNPSAPVKLVEYGSRTCPLCARFNVEGVPTLEAGYVASGKVSYEFRDFPVHGALDLAPILLGHCVSPRQFFPVLDRMFRQQVPLLAKVQDIAGSMPPNADANTVALTYAKGLGYLDLMERGGFVTAKLTACLADRRAVYRIATEARAAQIEGTPAFIINGQAIANVFNWADLQPILSAATK